MNSYDIINGQWLEQTEFYCQVYLRPVCVESHIATLDSQNNLRIFFFQLYSCSHYRYTEVLCVIHVYQQNGHQFMPNNLDTWILYSHMEINGCDWRWSRRSLLLQTLELKVSHCCSDIWGARPSPATAIAEIQCKTPDLWLKFCSWL